MSATSDLTAVVGPDRVIDDPAVCAIWSEDISGPSEHIAAAILRPANVEAAQAVIRWAAKAGRPVIARGAGMSYSRGYLQSRPGALMLDMADISGIRRIDPLGRTVTVEAGCTWSALREALAKHNLRTPFFGTLSGIQATVGGALSQNAMFFGSAAHGYAGDQVLGVEVIDGGGHIRRIGASAFGRSAALPNYGPALQGMFIGDAGAFGVKVAATLRVAPEPEVTAFASYSFGRAANIIAAQAALRDVPHLSEVYAFDRQTHLNLAATGFSVLEAAGMAADLTRGAGVAGAVGHLVKAATMRSAKLAELDWSLHVVIEPPMAELADAIAARVADTCGRHGGKAIPDTIPRVTRARPFRPIKALVGPNGERWLPCHGIFPADAADEGLAAIEAWKIAETARMDRFGVRLAILLASVGSEIVVEPQFFWPDSLSTFQQARAEVAQVEAYAENASNEAARSEVHTMRSKICAIFAALGAGHVQLGKYYPWISEMDAATRSLAHALKREMDPQGIFNPGALGL